MVPEIALTKINPAAPLDKVCLLGAIDTLNPAELTGSVTEAVVEMTQGGVDYSFECIGNVDVMRGALECCPMENPNFRGRFQEWSAGAVQGILCAHQIRDGGALK